jgi:hypothetical protein
MFPVLEDLAPKEQDPVNHYWLLVMNFRERRFEVLDSVRSLSDKSLDQKVNLLVGAIKTLWEQYYANSSVKLATWEIQDIKPPKQGSK